MRSLLICSFLVLNLFLSACQTSDPYTTSEKCMGLKRQITINKNTNSYDRNMLQSQRSHLEREYKALNCQ